MGLETGDYISSLNEAWPLLGDQVNQGDDHLRLLKHVLLFAFANGATSLTIKAGSTSYVFNQDGTITVNGSPLVTGGGTTILSGAGVPGAGVGSNGNYYVDTTNDNFYGPKSGTTWPLALLGFPEVAIDGNLYARRDAAWEVIPAYAPLANPVFTGNPRGPTPTAGDNDTSLATTAFVTTAISDYDASLADDFSAKAPLASPILTGDPRAPTPLTTDNDTSIATTAFVKAQAYATITYVDNADTTIMGAKADLASPIFTGDPRAPTPATADNDTSIATTAFVKAQSYLTTTTASSTYAPLASPVFTGNPTAPTPTAGDNDTSIATTAFVAASFAPLASPVFTGDPRAPTPTTADNDTSIATTAFVKAQAYAPLADPALTGNPTAPTQTAGNSSTRIATTAFVATSFAPLASPTFTGDPKSVTPATSDNDTSIATTAYVQAQGYKKITISSTAPGSPTTNDLWVDTA